MNGLTQLARCIFAKDIYATELTGIVIDNVEGNTAVCSLQLDSKHRNAKGAVMGGVIFTLADLAVAIAANSDILMAAQSADDVQLQWVTSSSTIHFLSSSRGDRLTAKTQMVKKGQRQMVVQVTVSDNLDRQVALVTSVANKITA